MKQFILSVLLTFFTLYLPLTPTPIRAAATTQDCYACILTDDVYLYASSNERSGLFLLPKTYYVKTLSVGAEFTKVQYQENGDGLRAITGYCKTAELTFVDYTPKTPYFHTLFEVTYKIADTNQNYPFLTEIKVECAYYGEYPIGSDTYCYVLREDGFGYVPKPSDLTFVENSEYADRKAQSNVKDETSQGSENTQSLPPSQIATVLVLCLLAPILASLILRANKQTPPLEDD
jgi:hypothetical protein